MAYDYSDVVSSIQENRNKYSQYFTDSDSNTVLSIETFFSLLMAEMTNQDPLEPTSNTEFVSQLANFTALQNSSNTLYYNTVSYAASLAGKTVTVATSDGGKGLLIDTGVVTGVDISDSTNIELIINGNRYSLGSVMNVAGSASTTTATSGVSSNDGAYAVSLIGKKVTLVAETASGGLIDEGIVESIEVENGEFRIVVNGYSYALSDIIKVNNADTASQTGSSGSTSSTGSADDAEAEEGETGNTETSIMEDNED